MSADHVIFKVLKSGSNIEIFIKFFIFVFFLIIISKKSGNRAYWALKRYLFWVKAQKCKIRSQLFFQLKKIKVRQNFNIQHYKSWSCYCFDFKNNKTEKALSPALPESFKLLVDWKLLLAIYSSCNLSCSLEKSESTHCGVSILWDSWPINRYHLVYCFIGGMMHRLPISRE